jgi:hypothetical protein
MLCLIIVHFILHILLVNYLLDNEFFSKVLSYFYIFKGCVSLFIHSRISCIIIFLIGLRQISVLHIKMIIFFKNVHSCLQQKLQLFFKWNIENKILVIA